MYLQAQGLICILVSIILNVGYIFLQVQCGDAELEKKVDEKIDQFIDRVEKHPNKKNQVRIFTR